MPATFPCPDADGSAEEGLDVPVALDTLSSEEPDDRLANGQPLGGLRGMRHRSYFLCEGRAESRVRWDSGGRRAVENRSRNPARRPGWTGGRILEGLEVRFGAGPARMLR